jgi:hypothetical protein
MNEWQNVYTSNGANTFHNSFLNKFYYFQGVFPIKKLDAKKSIY